MKVELLYHTPLSVLVLAIRTCYDSMEKSDSSYKPFMLNKPKFTLGDKDKNLINKVIDSSHLSTIEHLVYSFRLSGYSRALLQEKSRHRIASVSERSTRYCLGQLKNEDSFVDGTIILDWARIKKYIVITGEDKVDRASALALDALRECVIDNIPNDKAKYCLPDSLKSECIFTINARSLRNWFELRTSKRALWEIRNLSNMMYEVLPEDHKFLFENCIHKDNK